MRSVEPIEAADFGNWLTDFLGGVAGADLTPAMEECGQVLRRDVSDHFAKEEGPNGEWEPRSIDVGLIREEFPEDYARPLLVYSGDLYAAAAVRGAPGGINRFGRDEVVIGVSSAAIPYAGIHQYGGASYLPDLHRTIQIPARPYLWASNEAIDRCRIVIITYIVNNVL